MMCTFHDFCPCCKTKIMQKEGLSWTKPRQRPYLRNNCRVREAWCPQVSNTPDKTTPSTCKRQRQTLIVSNKTKLFPQKKEKDKNINCHLRQEALWPQMSASWQAQGQKHHFLETNNILIFCGMQTWWQNVEYKGTDKYSISSSKPRCVTQVW